INFVYSRAGQDAANLHFLPECNDVWSRTFSEVFVTPERAGEAYSGLHLVINEQCFVFVGQNTQLLHEFPTEMVVTALSLDRLYNDGAYLVPVVGECLLYLPDSLLFAFKRCCEVVGGFRKSPHRATYAGPVELSKPLRLVGLGVGKA